MLFVSSLFLHLSFDQVSRVSDAVSIGQQLSLMCIGQDVRGNIKLSLKATLPRPRADTNNVVEGSVPSVKEPNIWASVEEFSNEQENQNSTSEELSGSKNEMSGVNPSTSSIPSILIKSAAECDEEEKSAALSQNLKRTTSSAGASKSKCKSKNSPPEDHANDSPFSNSGLFSTKNVKKSKRVLQKEGDTESKSSQDGDTTNGLADKEDEVGAPITAKKMKIGKKLTAKVYEIRTHGLVLDLGGGLRGMYRFEVRVVIFLNICSSLIPFYIFISSNFTLQCISLLQFSHSFWTPKSPLLSLLAWLQIYYSAKPYLCILLSSYMSTCLVSLADPIHTGPSAQSLS